MNKNRDRRDSSMQNFIQGADLNGGVRSRKRITTDNVLLSATGKLQNRENLKSVLLYLPNDITQDIENYCSGTTQSILSYLIRRGLDELIKDKKIVIYELV